MFRYNANLEDIYRESVCIFATKKKLGMGNSRWWGGNVAVENITRDGSVGVAFCTCFYPGLNK